MNRTSILSFLVVAAGIGGLLASAAHSQIGNAKAYVRLQPTQPGTSQSGHSNISGVSRAGLFAGNGAALTNLNASELAFGTVPDARIIVGGDVAAPLSAATVVP